MIINSEIKDINTKERNDYLVTLLHEKVDFHLCFIFVIG